MCEVLYERIKVRNKCPSGLEPKWRLMESPLGGRGLFATVDLQTNDLLWIEEPLVLGPRSDIKLTPICVGCHKQRPLQPCSNNCGLPVCSVACQESRFHVKECRLLEKWTRNREPGIWSRELLTSVTSLRCYLLDDEELSIVKCLQGHQLPQHEFILNFIINSCKVGSPSTEDLQVIRHACEVLDAVSYETVCPDTDSLRGLYPIAALMNHDCSPNTRHCFDRENKMLVQVTKPIKKGEEITTTYTTLCWGTEVRQHHLKMTKNFVCKCERCRDITENGSNLQGLYCLKESCSGIVLPDANTTKWTCTKCNLTLEKHKMTTIQSTISSIVMSINKNEPRKAARILKRQLIVPNCNQLAVELKINLNWLYGHSQGFYWEDLTDDDVKFKEIICQEILLLLEVLKLGECRLKGLTLYELYLTLKEENKRKMKVKNCLKSTGYELKNILTTAATILQYDSSSQDILKEFEFICK